MSEDWARGYKEGFEAGYKMGRELNAPPSLPLWPQPQQPYNVPNTKGTSCTVCGMFWETGKAYGYVCGNSNCPSKVTCSTIATTGALWANTVSSELDNHYEQAYGKDLYNQMKKDHKFK